MKNYIYQNTLISKKQLRELLGWSFTNYDSMQACFLSDKLKQLGFHHATNAGISISIEDLKIPFVKNLIINKANDEIFNAEKIYLTGKITEVERFQKIIDTWNLTSESLKNQIIYYFKHYDPLNSVYIMAFSGARGNLSQVRQLIGMRGLMSDPSGQIMNLPIKKNFREGLTITDYLISGYGARKGIIDTALKTANSGYLTRRLIDVAQDILIREKDCLTKNALLFQLFNKIEIPENQLQKKLLGRVLSHSIYNKKANSLIAQKNTQITPELLKKLKTKNIKNCYVRSPLTCRLYRAICQKCYGWELATENLIDIGDAIGILAGQSIGEPGTQLTMRTFHTGGVFTAGSRENILSPVNGIIKFSSALQKINLRTNRGDEVFIAKNFSSLILIPDEKNGKLIKIDFGKNTILFPKNNQYIVKNTVIAELINKNKQIKTEIKTIISDTSGEIFIPKLNQKFSRENHNRLIWILAGQLYNSPLNSFLNFFYDYKLNHHTYIFRTKLINNFTNIVKFNNCKKSLDQQILQFTQKIPLFKNSKLQKLNKTIINNNHLLRLNNWKYLVNIEEKNSKNYLQITRYKKFGTLLTNSFKTLTGGKIYYDCRNLLTSCNKNKVICYNTRSKEKTDSKIITTHRTICWIGKVIYKINCEKKGIFIEEGDYVSKGFEIVSGLFLKKSGLIVSLQRQKNIVTIHIKLGIIYEGTRIKRTKTKLYYPGEALFSNVIIKELSISENINEKNNNQILISPIEIYESCNADKSFQNKNLISPYQSRLNLKFKSVYLYKSNQLIQTSKNLDLISKILLDKTKENSFNKRNIQFFNNKLNTRLDNIFHKTIYLKDYLFSQLKYQNIESCLLVQKTQFLSSYLILGYLEALTVNSLEIIKFKIKNQINKQIFLISNQDCLKIKKSEITNKALNDFIISKTNLERTGKIIEQNNNEFIIQKARPYFFPNCKPDTLKDNLNLEYKLLPILKLDFKIDQFKDKKNLLNYYNKNTIRINNNFKKSFILNEKISLRSEFSKLFFKSSGKLYKSLIPRFIRKYNIKNEESLLKFNSILQPKLKRKRKNKKICKTLLVKNSITQFKKKKIQKDNNLIYQLILVKFSEQPFTRSTKAVGLYSITEDYFEQQVNNLFCKNNEFIQNGKTIGLLNLEKEITGDIVQGLPRIEEILEARKKNITTRSIPMNQKKGLLIQKSCLDVNLEFKKLGTTIQDNDKINPHKLLKIYFNYYGFSKLLLSEINENFKTTCLVNNYEGSYKSFKKVQVFILNSVQSVYKSQGVNINDKHLEIIIKQMTTKVLITDEGNTPLLKREVLDLYHIQYINRIIDQDSQQIAYYVPLLLGITKSALNNPSFISAASFQETTRILTNAAIEGRIDWLRGLKENIIIGHLIPSGTGTHNYQNCFRKNLIKV